MSVFISESSKNAQSQRWSTDDELAYVRGMGRWGTSKVPVLDLLKGYEASISRRCKWDAIDAAKVREVVSDLIRFHERSAS